ncbi:DsbA family protein [Salinivibrio kushneri]|uniref:DsbA family protein n=1 Tax=Salinivibrio kushneri TaxID=1908198 RepID=A0AA47KJC1_9GAMM|nr:DsbA family protein [Salinivibrio kushneri]WBA07990.1 DsbA family protein [Salinivibrio kushneri]
MSLSRYIAPFWALLLLALPVSANTLSDTEQAQLDEIVSLLEENPKLIANLNQSLQKFVEQQKTLKENLAARRDWFESDTHSWIGAENPEVTVVNFMDYNCPYCKKLEEELQKLVAAHDDVKVINIAVPLKQQSIESLGTNSAVYAMNVWLEKPEAFAQVHQLLMNKRGMHDARSLEKIAKKTDTEALLEGKEVTGKAVAENYRAFVELGLRGTPAMIIGEQVAPGYLPYPQLEAMVDAARADG